MVVLAGMIYWAIKLNREKSDSIQINIEINEMLEKYPSKLDSLVSATDDSLSIIIERIDSLNLIMETKVRKETVNLKPALGR